MWNQMWEVVVGSDAGSSPQWSRVGFIPLCDFSSHIKDGKQLKSIQTSVLRVPHEIASVQQACTRLGPSMASGRCVDWACHVINSRLDPLYLIKAIPSGEQTSMSVWNQAKEGRWPHCHPQLVQGAGGRRGRGRWLAVGIRGAAQRLCCQPHPRTPWCPCDSLVSLC